MADRYEDVPVFQANGDFTRPEHLVGRATVEIDDDGKGSIVIETSGDIFTDFLKMGKLKALSLGGMVYGIDVVEAEKYYEKYS